ncbi:MAG: T9SS type A sorting domain-containing protein [Flavobacteriales bacterium]
MNGTEQRPGTRTRRTYWRQAALSLATLCTAGLFAQVTVTIDGSAYAGQGTTGFAPMGNTGHHASEHVYLATEIGQDFTINRIELSNNLLLTPAALNTYNAVSIYLYTTPNTTFAGGTFTTAGKTLVYSGSITWNAVGFAGVDLTTPFAYTQASGNLAMLVVRGDNVIHTANIFNSARGNATAGVTALTSRRYNGATAPVNGTTTLTTSAFRAAARFMFVPTCSGTPTPGNTLASVSGACSGQSFTLSLQNAAGNGASYVWELDNGGGWTVFGTNAATQVVTQTGPTSYRCTVDCPAGGGSPTNATSNPIAVPMAAPFPVDFAPVVFPSNCWSATAATTLLRSTVNAYGAAGQGAAQWNYYNAGTGTVLTITSPTFTAVGAGQQIRFDVAGAAYSGDGGVTVDSDILNVEASTDGGANWTTLAAMSNNTGGDASTAPPQAANFVPTAGQWATRTYNVPTGTNMVRFRGVSGFGNNVYVDNIVVEPIPTCLPPTSVAAIGLSATDASVSWSGTGTFIVEYGPASTFTVPGSGAAQGPEGTSTVLTGIAGNSVTIPGLVHPTQYRVFVRTDCTGSNEGYSTNSPGITFYTRPPFDDCSAITTFPSVAPGGTILITGNNFGATDSEGFGALVSWEAFTLTGCVSSLNIDYCGSTPPRTNAFVNLFTGCPSTGFIPWTGAPGPTCPNGSVNVPYNTIPAGTYYIAVINQAGASGPYGINVTAGPACPPPPANDLCVDATPIACGDVLSGTTVDATNTGAPATVCNGFLNNTSGGVWYVASGLCGPVQATICSTLPSWDSKLAIYSGSCGSLVCVTTDDDGCGPIAGLSVANWNADVSETYYIYVLGFGAADEGTFSLTLNCTSTPVVASATVNDNCGSNEFGVAVDVTDLGGAASVDIAYSVNGVPQTPVAGAGLGITSLGPFTPGAEVTVSVSNGGSGCTADLGSFFSNCPVDVVCGSTVTYTHCYSNNDPRTWTFNPPNAGESVTVTFVNGTIDVNDIIRIYSGVDNSGTLLASSTVSNLNGLTGTSLIGESIFIEIDTDPSNSCADGGQSTWVFEVECTAGCVDPDGSVTPNVDCGTYSFTLDVEVLFTGDGATTDLVYTVDGGAPTTVPGLIDFDLVNIGPFTIGSVVNVVLAHEFDGACNRNLGNFQPGLACPPPGTSCALPLVVNSFPYTQTNTTCGKGNNLIGTQCGLGANYGGGEDFVYQLNIPSAGDYQISMQLSGGNSFAGWFLKSSGNCSTAASCVANAVTTVVNGTATGIVSLAAGTYFLIIDSRPLPNCVDYTVTVAPFVFQPGDNCNIALPLTVGSSCTPTAGSVAGLTQSIPGGVCGGTADDDIWYSFVATNTSHTVTLDADFDAVLEVRSGACNGANLGCADNNFSTGIEELSVNGLTVGATYFVRLWSWSSAVQTTPTFDLCVTEPPPAIPGDDCATAFVIPSVPATVSGSTGLFADNYNAVCPFNVTGGRDVVYSYTPTSNEVINASLCLGTTEYDTKLYVFLNDCNSAAIACNDDACANPPLFAGAFISSISNLAVTAGNTYYFVVDGFSGADFGDYTLELSIAPQPPANDDCANAIALPGCNSSISGTTVSANGADSPLDNCGTTSNTSPGVWYTVQGWGGGMSAGVCGSTTADTKIAIYSGSCGALTCVGGNDDGCGLQSFASWNSTLGTTYYIYVFAFGATTEYDFVLEVTCGDNQPICNDNGLTLEFQTDLFSDETTWEIIPDGFNTPACAGGGFFPPNATVTDFCCLPDGCYRMRVLDAFGDGMVSGSFVGGYILRTSGSNQRIIDNRNNFDGAFDGDVSAISGGQGFCLPISNQGLVYTSCDKLDWINGQYVVTSANPAVSAEWIVGGANNVQDNNSGYEFWIFDPNGSYSFRRFRSHNQSDGFGPASATRACHMKLNNWALASQVPANVLMNVRVRARVNGVNGEFGPACRLMIDPVRAACPLTKLMDIPGNQYLSCGATRQWGTGNFVHARPVSGANRYQFRFRLPAEGFEVVRQTTTYFLQLNWPTLPLEVGKTYDVDVRVSKDGGATWCSTDDPWGDVCQLTIGGSNFNAMADINGTGAAGELKMFPNPNRGDQLTFSLSAIEEGVNTVTLDVYDMFGKRVMARELAVAGSSVNTTLDLKGALAAGMYVVNITAGSTSYTERLVIQP